MARQILFIQGAGEGTHDEWDAKLVASLQEKLGNGFPVTYPRMPDEDDPGYSAWKPRLKAEFGKLSDGAILVGHSFGGTALIHALAEDPPKFRIGGIFLIAAPFAGEKGWEIEGIKAGAAFADHLPAGVPIYIYHGDADDSVPESHANLYGKAIPQAQVRILKGRDHQLNDDLSEVARDIRSVV